MHMINMNFDQVINIEELFSNLHLVYLSFKNYSGLA